MEATAVTAEAPITMLRKRVREEPRLVVAEETMGSSSNHVGTGATASSNPPCKKGDVYYVLNGYTDANGDPKPGRPAVIVSNDHLGKTSDWVCVVYMTTATKKAMPEHVTLFNDDPKAPKSTVMCERVNCVQKNRLGQYMRHLSDAEIERIDTALMISLGIGRNIAAKCAGAEADHEVAVDQEAVEEAKFYKRMCDYLTSKLKGGEQAIC